MVRLCPPQVEREIRSLQTEKRCKAGRPAVRPAAATEGRLLHKHGALHGPYLWKWRRCGSGGGLRCQVTSVPVEGASRVCKPGRARRCEEGCEIRDHLYGPHSRSHPGSQGYRRGRSSVRVCALRRAALAQGTIRRAGSQHILARIPVVARHEQARSEVTGASNGGRGGVRTCDLLRVKQALYH